MKKLGQLKMSKQTVNTNRDNLYRDMPLLKSSMQLYRENP